mgnify:CR=1 FL=1
MMKQLIRLGLMLVAVLAMVSCTPSTTWNRTEKLTCRH